MVSLRCVHRRNSCILVFLPLGFLWRDLGGDFDVLSCGCPATVRLSVAAPWTFPH